MRNRKVQMELIASKILNNYIRVHHSYIFLSCYLHQNSLFIERKKVKEKSSLNSKLNCKTDFQGNGFCKKKLDSEGKSESKKFVDAFDGVEIKKLYFWECDFFLTSLEIFLFSSHEEFQYWISHPLVRIGFIPLSIFF